MSEKSSGEKYGPGVAAICFAVAVMVMSLLAWALWSSSYANDGVTMGYRLATLDAMVDEACDDVSYDQNALMLIAAERTTLVRDLEGLGVVATDMPTCDDGDLLISQPEDVDDE